MTERQTMVHKILHRKLIEQHKSPPKIPGMKSGAPEGWDVMLMWQFHLRLII
jgi:hypothetical protein